MANAKPYAVGATAFLVGLAVLIPAETLTAAPGKANPRDASARYSPLVRTVAKIAPARFALGALARPTKRRADQVVLQLGVGF